MCPQLSPSGSCDSECWGFLKPLELFPLWGRLKLHCPTSHWEQPSVQLLLLLGKSRLPHLLLGINSISQLPTVYVPAQVLEPYPHHRAKSKLPVRDDLPRPSPCLPPASGLPSLLFPGASRVTPILVSSLLSGEPDPDIVLAHSILTKPWEGRCYYCSHFAERNPAEAQRC